MRIQNVSCTIAGLFFSCSLLLASSASLAAEEWNIKNKNHMIQVCFDKAEVESRATYKALFYGKMSNLEYDAFLVSNNTQLLQSCQCVVNRITSEYQPTALFGNPEGASSYANTLSGDDGPCGTNQESLLADMRSRMSGSL